MEGAGLAQQGRMFYLLHGLVRCSQHRAVVLYVSQGGHSGPCFILWQNPYSSQGSARGLPSWEREWLDRRRPSHGSAGCCCALCKLLRAPHFCRDPGNVFCLTCGWRRFIKVELCPAERPLAGGHGLSATCTWQRCLSLETLTAENDKGVHSKKQKC